MVISINEHAKNNYLKQTNLIEFLLAENLALKTLLHDKGILTPEEFEGHKRKAKIVLAETIDIHIEMWKESHPEEVKLFEKVTAS